MSQALIISDNEVLNDICAVNLQAYTATNITIKKNPNEAVQLLNLSPNYDLIVVLDKIGELDVGKLIFDLLKSKSWDMPLVVIGERSLMSNTPYVETLPATYNIPRFIKTVAKLLGITAQAMAKLPMPAFYPIPLRLFNGQKQLICDVYFKMGKGQSEYEYIKLWPAGSDVDQKYDAYTKEGVKLLYIPSEHRLKFINASTELITRRLENAYRASPEEKVQIVEQGFEVLADKLFNNEAIGAEVMEISKSCSKVLSDAMKEATKLKGLLAALLANKSSFIYMHSVMSTYVASHIVRNISWGGEGHIEKISYVLFFHDIFLVPIYNKYPQLRFEQDILHEDLTENEKDIVLRHARLAGEMVKDFTRAPIGADTIITQHHGMTNGEGMAMDFKDDISPLAKVVAVAEVFVDEMLKQKDEGASNYKLDDIITVLVTRFKRSSYRRIIDTLSTISL